MGIFYFIFVWRGLRFLKFAIQNNPLMELRLIFHKAVNKSKLNVIVINFKVIGLVVFQQLRKLLLEWKGRGFKFVLFLPLFLSIHINFQYKLNSHKNLFIVAANFYSSIALLIFSHLHFHCYFL